MIFDDMAIKGLMIKGLTIRNLIQKQRPNSVMSFF